MAFKNFVANIFKSKRRKKQRLPTKSDFLKKYKVSYNATTHGGSMSVTKQEVDPELNDNIGALHPLKEHKRQFKNVRKKKA